MRTTQLFMMMVSPLLLALGMAASQAGELALVRCNAEPGGPVVLRSFSISNPALIATPELAAKENCALFLKQLQDKGFAITGEFVLQDAGTGSSGTPIALIYRLSR
jgi:hypothetical protein